MPLYSYAITGLSLLRNWAWIMAESLEVDWVSMCNSSLLWNIRLTPSSDRNMAAVLKVEAHSSGFDWFNWWVKFTNEAEMVYPRSPKRVVFQIFLRSSGRSVQTISLEKLKISDPSTASSCCFPPSSDIRGLFLIIHTIFENLWKSLTQLPLLTRNNKKKNITFFCLRFCWCTFVIWSSSHCFFSTLTVAIKLRWKEVDEQCNQKAKKPTGFLVKTYLKSRNSLNHVLKLACIHGSWLYRTMHNLILDILTDYFSSNKLTA